MIFCNQGMQSYSFFNLLTYTKVLVNKRPYPPTLCSGKASAYATSYAKSYGGQESFGETSSGYLPVPNGTFGRGAL